MATQKRVYNLVKRLVDEGVVYFGQPTASLEAVLRHRAARWKTRYPDGRTVPWGEGPNESLENLVSQAQEIIYGIALAWEEIYHAERTRPGTVAQAIRMRGSRPPGSCYQQNPNTLVSWLLAGGKEAADLREIACELSVFAEIRLSCHPVVARQIAETYAWFQRRCHALADHTLGWRQELELLQLIPLWRRWPHKSLMLAWHMAAGPEGAEELLKLTHGRLDELEQVRAVQRKMESAA